MEMQNSQEIVCVCAYVFDVNRAVTRKLLEMLDKQGTKSREVGEQHPSNDNDEQHPLKWIGIYFFVHVILDIVFDGAYFFVHVMFWFEVLKSQIQPRTPYMLYKDAINKKK